MRRTQPPLIEPARAPRSGASPVTALASTHAGGRLELRATPPTRCFRAAAPAAPALVPPLVRLSLDRGRPPGAVRSPTAGPPGGGGSAPARPAAELPPDAAPSPREPELPPRAARGALRASTRRSARYRAGR